MQSSTASPPKVPDLEPLYVQYGCGWAAPDGWLNFDASPTLRFERLPVVGRLYTRNAERFPSNARPGNIVSGLPIASGSVTGLYASHVLEHLSLEDCRDALANSFNLLRPGGIFRLIVPDLRARAERYLAENRAGDAGAAIRFMEGTCLGMRRRGRGFGAVAAAFGNSQHIWMWDELSMKRELAAAGFASIRSCAFGDCDDRAFDLVEDRGRFRDDDIDEVALECRRPS
jgi:hypothetical protein